RLPEPAHRGLDALSGLRLAHGPDPVAAPAAHGCAAFGALCGEPPDLDLVSAPALLHRSAGRLGAGLAVPPYRARPAAGLRGPAPAGAPAHARAPGGLSSYGRSIVMSACSASSTARANATKRA